MSEKIGIIGTGAMGGTIAHALSESGMKEVYLFDILHSRMEEVIKKTGFKGKKGVEDFKDEDLIIVAVKPKDVNDVLLKLNSSMKDGACALSIAAGIRIKKLRETIKRNTIYVARAMPNVCAKVMESATALCFEKGFPETLKKLSFKIFSIIGKVYEFEDENYMDIFTALGGSGPAVVWKFLKGIEDAGVLMGIPRDKALDIGIQVLYGSAKLIKEKGGTPDELIKLVTSPGGTTVEALYILDKSGFNGILIEALVKAFEKASKLGKD
jgi:pyrroline-5-carboxylate reductase